MANPTEAQTRQQLIDPALEKAGWDVKNPEQVGLEIPVDSFDPQAWQKLESKLGRLRDEGVAFGVHALGGFRVYVNRDFAIA